MFRALIFSTGLLVGRARPLAVLKELDARGWRTKRWTTRWSQFFLECVCEAADDGVAGAQRLFALLAEDRQAVVAHTSVTISAVRLFDQLPKQPIITLAKVMEILNTTKPTASKAIDSLQQAGVLREITGKQRDRVYAYDRYLAVLNRGMG